MIFAVIAVASLAFAIYARAQSPTVIRVDKDGDAAVLRGSRPIESWDILRVPNALFVGSSLHASRT